MHTRKMASKTLIQHHYLPEACCLRRARQIPPLRGADPVMRTGRSKEVIVATLNERSPLMILVSAFVDNLALKSSEFRA